MCCREEHGEVVSSVVGCLAAATKSLDLQMSLKDEQLRLVTAAVVEDRLLSWVPLHSPIKWRMILVLSNSMDPTQDTGNQLKEVESAAGNRNA